MKAIKVAKCLLFAGLLAIIAGCKVAVLVVEGGEVQSIGSGTCAAGTICIVEVNDTNFSETFTALPDYGWYFQKWNSGDGFFCGGSTDSTCTLSFQGYEESKEVEDVVASPETFYIMPVFKPFQAIVTVNGNEWLQPIIFANLAWNDINAICPDGICVGSLNSYNLTGWTWASIEDVNALLNYYISGEPCPGEYDNVLVLGPGPDLGCLYWPDSAWRTAFYRDGWQPMKNGFLSGRSDLEKSTIVGWMRDRSKSGGIYFGGIYHNYSREFFFGDIAFTDSFTFWGPYDSAVGGWFYRSP